MADAARAARGRRRHRFHHRARHRAPLAATAAMTRHRLVRRDTARGGWPCGSRYAARRVLARFALGFAWFVYLVGPTGGAPRTPTASLHSPAARNGLRLRSACCRRVAPIRLLLSGIGGGAELAEAGPAGRGRRDADRRAGLDRTQRHHDAWQRPGDRRMGAGQRDPLIAGGDSILPHAPRACSNCAARCRTRNCIRCPS